MARPEMSSALQQLLTDEESKVMALIGTGDGGASPFFFSARWPAYRGLFEGIYFAVQGDTVEEAVEAFRRQLWRGL